MKIKRNYHELNVMKENFNYKTKKMKKIKITIKSMFNLHKAEEIVSAKVIKTPTKKKPYKLTTKN